MSEMDESEWRSLISSPRGLNPSLSCDDFEAKEEPLLEYAVKAEKFDAEDYAFEKGFDEQENRVMGSVSGTVAAGVAAADGAVIRSGGSIAERRAAKCGFNAARISTPRFRTTSPVPSPAARSPNLTIPPGISPTALLDSPIMLPNTQAQASPTTGTFPLVDPVMTSVDGSRANNIGPSFRFKPQGNPVPFRRFPEMENQTLGASALYQAIDPLHPVNDFEFPAEFLKATGAGDYAVGLSNDLEGPNPMFVNAKDVHFQTCHSGGTSDQVYQQKQPIGKEDGSREGEQIEASSGTGTIRSTEDGYNWRKYGQKQVKGSEYPRSYYKCTHQNCPVKKKVERSYDGQITEIIYKGGHSHPKPQLSRRSALASGFSSNETEMGEGSGSCVKAEGWSSWKNIPVSKEVKICSDWRTDGLERTSSTSVVTELSDPLSTPQGKSVGVLESAGTPELSSTLASHDDDDRVTQGSISLGDDADDEESESKRRKKENCLIETNMPSRSVREPRVVVQIESDIDILDDGYRWRKYGQKVVKGNPNPRSYYKCTSTGCCVRKHVERASNNLKAVITTYEGKHNHDVPAAKNSSHTNTGGNLPPSAPHGHGGLQLPRSASMPKPDANIQELMPQFERKPEFGAGFLTPSFLGNFNHDMKFGTSSIYQMKFPPFQNGMPYGSFGLNPNLSALNHTQSVTHLPDFPMSLPLNLPHTANVALAGLDFHNQLNPIGGLQPHISGQPSKETDMRFIRPKREQKDESLLGPCLPIVDHPNSLSASSSASTMYCHMMGSYQ